MQLLCVGDGPERRRVERLIRERAAGREAMPAAADASAAAPGSLGLP